MIHVSIVSNMGANSQTIRILNMHAKKKKVKED